MKGDRKGVGGLVAIYSGYETDTREYIFEKQRERRRKI